VLVRVLVYWGKSNYSAGKRDFLNDTVVYKDYLIIYAQSLRVLLGYINSDFLHNFGSQRVRVGGLYCCTHHYEFIPGEFA